jgi:hypothetical protein
MMNSRPNHDLFSANSVAQLSSCTVLTRPMCGRAVRCGSTTYDESKESNNRGKEWSAVQTLISKRNTRSRYVGEFQRAGQRLEGCTLSQMSMNRRHEEWQAAEVPRIDLYAHPPRVLCVMNFGSFSLESGFFRVPNPRVRNSVCVRSSWQLASYVSFRYE